MDKSSGNGLSKNNAIVGSALVGAIVGPVVVAIAEGPFVGPIIIGSIVGGVVGAVLYVIREALVQRDPPQM